MPKYKNISGGPLDYPVLDRVVEDGEIVDVPEYQPGAVPDKDGNYDPAMRLVVPPDKWQPVKEKASSGKADG